MCESGSDERSCDVSITKQHTTQQGPAQLSGNRPVLKCRCGGLYRNPDAHHDAFGHRPDPVYADLGHRPDPMFDPLRYQAGPPHDGSGHQPGRVAA
jgi:hypothetical protein